ncbi:MAG: hypothetical protein HYZ34_07055 [Ignavibacteriae bacterium]|nr:hypothetical protein [Ignavibacteriota bacterium]
MKEESLIQLFKKKSTLKKSLDHTNRFYRPYDPGLFLYKLLMDYSGEYLSDYHIKLIYTTLIAWNMNSRGAKLFGYKKFRNGILKIRNLFQDLRSLYIEKLSSQEFEETFIKIKKIYSSLKISKTKTQLISFSKTLHFLLPNLIMPIDRKHTIKFFYNRRNINHNTQFNDFYAMHKILLCVSLRYNLKDYLDQNWNRNIPKIFDNSIIGYVRNKNV